jgi:hypothetical protein
MCVSLDAPTLSYVATPLLTDFCCIFPFIKKPTINLKPLSLSRCVKFKMQIRSRQIVKAMQQRANPPGPGQVVCMLAELCMYLAPAHLFSQSTRFLQNEVIRKIKSATKTQNEFSAALPRSNIIIFYFIAGRWRSFSRGHKEPSDSFSWQSGAPAPPALSSPFAQLVLPAP